MHNVIYYCGGTVADFPIDEARYQDFADRLATGLRHSEAELTKARTALERFVHQAESDPKAEAGPTELSAACYVWDYFNTNPDPVHHIDGDVLIIDLNGEGETIEYAAAADVQLAPEH